MSWFSGAPLDPGVFYDPVSLAFQPKVARINASGHLSVAYDWAGGQLKSVHTKYEEKKTASNIAKLALAGAAASQGVGSTVGWRTPDRETNDFYFNYYDDEPQILSVNRNDTVVKSRRIPISIPGVGGFGGFGALGGLGALGSLRTLGGMRGFGSLGAMKGLGGAGGFGGLAGLPGTSGSGGLLATANMLRQTYPSQTYSIHADPQGGFSSGFLTLWNSPRLDTRLAYMATGKRAAVGFSGNRYFHPFVWDAIHLFEFDYDEQGRVRHAWELDDPNAARLDFTWDGRRLMSISAHEDSPSGATLYLRTLNYSGTS